jgi:hypothetical protein
MVRTWISHRLEDSFISMWPFTIHHDTKWLSRWTWPKCVPVTTAIPLHCQYGCKRKHGNTALFVCAKVLFSFCCKFCSFIFWIVPFSDAVIYRCMKALSVKYLYSTVKWGGGDVILEAATSVSSLCFVCLLWHIVEDKHTWPWCPLRPLLILCPLPLDCLDLCSSVH